MVEGRWDSLENQQKNFEEEILVSERDYFEHIAVDTETFEHFELGNVFER